MVIALIITYVAYRYEIYFNVDLTLLSIAIIFPLVFTIRGSFRRREKALEHLSEFRSTINTVRYFLMNSNGIDDAYKNEVNKILYDINNTTLDYLNKKEYSLNDLDILTHKVFEFVSEKNELVPSRTREKVFRFMKDLHESIENLHAIHSHRTPISLKAYCEIFIYIFPLIYAPTIIYNIGLDGANWITYFVVALTQFILISLYNIQNQLEYPFDNVGMDDINLENFRIER